MRALVVVTRVAIRFGRSTPSEEWVRYRLGILERLAVPAMARVTAPFTWVWRTADRHRAAVEGAAPPGVVVVDQDATVDSRIEGSRFLVVRMDSDDAFLPAALDAVARLELVPNTLVDWPDGWQYEPRGGHVATVTYRGRHQGPFLGVTQESRERMFDVGGQHTQARKGRKVRRILGPSWVQAIHDRNTLNAWRDGSPADTRGVLGRFGVEPW